VATAEEKNVEAQDYKKLDDQTDNSDEDYGDNVFIGLMKDKPAGDTNKGGKDDNCDGNSSEKADEVKAQPFDDRPIVEKAKKGDKVAFEQLVKLYSKYVYTTAFFMMRDSHDAEDISQEVFVKVFLSIKNFRGLSSFKTWLRKLTVNTCIDKLRIKAKTADKKVGLEAFEDSYEIIFPSFNHNLERNFLTRETLREVLNIIVKMDESYRIPLILRDLQDYSYREISILINKPIGTVKTNIHRARKIIKDKVILKKEKDNG
jgi:RNA polymerase sigma-70 factor, ECF subfamily